MIGTLFSKVDGASYPFEKCCFQVAGLLLASLNSTKLCRTTNKENAMGKRDGKRHEKNITVKETLQTEAGYPSR